MTYSSNTTCKPDPAPARAVWRRLAVVAAGLLAFAQAPASQAASKAGDLIVEAREALSRGDAIAAEASLNHALANDASRKAVAAYMGRAMLMQGKPKRARKWLGTASFSPASAADGFRALALLEVEEGNLKAAGGAYDRALRLAPEDASLWVEIARLRYRGGEHLLAIDAANHAVRLDSENVSALELKGQLVRDRLGLGPSLAWFERAHELAPDDISILGEYAATAGDLGQAKKMLELTRRMLELDPDNARAFYLQAVLAARAGNYRLGRVLMNKTRGTMKDVPGAMLLEGVLELGAGNFTLAVEALDPLVKRQPANGKARNLLARALFMASEHRYLVERFSADARRRDASPYLRVLVARSYEVLGQRAKAAPLLQAASRGYRSPLRIEPEANRIGEFLAAGRIGEADALVQRWLAENPDYYDHLAAAGDVQLARGDGKAAMRYYAQAARIRMPENLLTRRFQAMILAGEPEKAAVLAETYLGNNPSSIPAMRLSAWVAALSGDWERARTLYETLRENSGGRDVQLLSDLALAQLRTGDGEAAEANARMAYGLQRSSGVAAQAWGLGLVAKGEEKAAASALLEKAKRILGDNPLLARGRKKLAGKV